MGRKWRSKMRKLIGLFAVLGMVFALAPAAQAAIVPITSVTTSGSIDLDSFTAGGTLYTTATDLVAGTSVDTGTLGGQSGVVGNQDNFDLNLIYSRGGNSGLNATWTTVSFGGANWSDSNGSDEDFFVFEAGGNDSISVRPIFVGGGVGQYTVLSTKGGIVNWGSTGVTITGPIRTGDTIYGLGFAITDLKNGAGAALTNSDVIMGLDFNGFNTDIASISAVAVPATPSVELDGGTTGSVDENQAIGTAVGALSTVNTGSWTLPITFSFNGGADDASFTIDGTSLKTAEIFDKEVKDPYVIDVLATDSAGAPNTANSEFTITIGDVTEPGGAMFARGEVQTGLTLVGTLEVLLDPADASVSYAVDAAYHGAMFEINGAAGELHLKAAPSAGAVGDEYFVQVTPSGNSSGAYPPMLIKVTVMSGAVGTVIRFR
jgi:hypothetical protein